MGCRMNVEEQVVFESTYPGQVSLVRFWRHMGWEILISIFLLQSSCLGCLLSPRVVLFLLLWSIVIV